MRTFFFTKIPTFQTHPTWSFQSCTTPLSLQSHLNPSAGSAVLKLSHSDPNLCCGEEHRHEQLKETSAQYALRRLLHSSQHVASSYVCQWMNRKAIPVCDTGILFSLQKHQRSKPWVCDSMDEPSGHYILWAKPGIKRPYVILHIRGI